MPLRCYPVAMLLLLGAMACAKEVPAPPATLPVAGSGMPTFERRPLAIAEEDLPQERFLMFDVVSDGSVIYQSSFDKGPMLRRIDSTGRLLEAFGREGEGPGELRGLAFLEVRGDTLQIYNSERKALIDMTLSGKLLRERRIEGFDSRLVWHPDSVDHWNATPRPGQSPRVMRSAIGKSEGRVLFDSTNAMFTTAITKRTGQATSPTQFSYTATTDRMWVADPWEYRISTFKSDGTPISSFVHAIEPNRFGPRALAETRERIMKTPRFMRGPNGERIPLADDRGRLDTLERESIRHFTRNPLHVDEFGRLWVVGVSRDSTSVDLFSDTTFVGRVMLPCYASGVGIRVAFGRGGWMVLECEVEDGDWPTELQLYRIVEKPTP
ncbi:MAG: hypothetical protein KA745_06360 [Gemmatimonadales bacterium]|nr:hypothetical protein [Gemmatimonadales bacterium]MBP9897217.1 hypothetical protein [Gemmatimonadales bacterium]HQW66133.1 hypothetical protein [Gemmatimonadales bacterium]